MPIPQSIGKYQLEALIGEGGMGKVYKAFDPRMCRYLAIKVLRQDRMGDPQREDEFRKRFFREGQICGRLNHPNIVTIYDMDEAEEALFIAMEYIQGLPITAFIRKDSSFTWEQKLSLLQQIASALDYAHSLGVVHRDLKPSNILWSDQGSAKITDFGIAKLLEENESRLTRPGMFVGTPRYSSPEQIQGLAITSQSDVFSFGILAFEVLTGVSPFPGSSISEILFKIASGEVDYRPITSDLNFAHPPVRELFTKVFKTNPKARYRKAGDFFKALNECLEQMVHQPGTKMSPSETVRLERQTWSTPPLSPTPIPEFQDTTSAESAKASDPSSPYPHGSSLPDTTQLKEGDTTQLPSHPSPTMRIPRAFLDLGKPPEPQPPPSHETISPPFPAIDHALPNSNAPISTPPTATHYSPTSADPSTSQLPRKTSVPSAARGPKQPTPISARYSSEESPKPWWIILVAIVFLAFLGFGWLLWPEIKKLVNGNASSEQAQNSRPVFGFGHGDESPPGDTTASQSQPLKTEPEELGETPIQAEDSEAPTQRDLPAKLPESEPETSQNSSARVPMNTPTGVNSTKPEPKKEPTSPSSNSDQTAPIQTRPNPQPARSPVVVEPQITRRVNPIFPEEGRAAGIEGEVVLEAELRFDGMIGNISVLKMIQEGRYGFENAAVKALLDYQFIPGTVDGVPKTLRKEFSFQFRLQERTRVGQQRFAELADETLRGETSPSTSGDQGVLQKPVFYKKVPPLFPEAGKAAGLSGSVILKATLAGDGTIRDIRVIQGLGDGQYGFEAAAIEAFRLWEFHPGKINGAPADMPIEVSLQFKLAPPNPP